MNVYYADDIAKVNSMLVFNTRKHSFVNSAHAEITFFYFYLTSNMEDCLSEEERLGKDNNVHIRTEADLEKSFKSFEQTGFSQIKKETNEASQFNRTKERVGTVKKEMKTFEIPIDTDKITVFCTKEENLMNKWLYLLNYIRNRGNPV